MYWDSLPGITGIGTMYWYRMYWNSELDIAECPRPARMTAAAWSTHVLGQCTWYFFWYCLYWDNVPTWYRMYRSSLTGIACIGTVYRTWYRRGSPTSPDDSWAAAWLYACIGIVYLASQRVPDQPGWQLQPDSTQSPWDPHSSEQAAETWSCVTIYSRTQSRETIPLKYIKMLFKKG